MSQPLLQSDFSGEQVLVHHLLTCLEIVYRLDYGHYISRRRDALENCGHGLICHRTLIQRLQRYRGRIDAIHLLPILLYTECLSCSTSAEQSACTMGSRAVPVFVSLSNAYKTAITHLDRDQKLFAGSGRNSSLADNIGIMVNVIMVRNDP